MKVLHLHPDVEAIIGAARCAPSHVDVGILRVGAGEALRGVQTGLTRGFSCSNQCIVGVDIVETGTSAICAYGVWIAKINLACALLIHVRKVIKMVSLCADISYLK